MKRYRLIYFLICLSLLVNMSNVAAKTAEAENSFAVGVISYLLPGYAAPDGEVTRRDFVKLVIDLCYGTKASEKTGFDDVDEFDEASGEISLAKNLGIISEGGLFFPQLPISRNQAAKIMVSALGYSEYAKYSGGYPGGYNAAADMLGLFENTGGGDYIGGAEIEQVLMNMLCAPVCTVTVKDGAAELDSDDDKTILSEKYKIFEFEGKQTANYLTGMTQTEKKTPQNMVEIDGEQYRTTAAEDFLGYNVRGYYEESDGEKVIVALEPEKNGVVEFDAEDVESFDGEKLEFDSGDRVKRVRIDRGYAFIYNKKAYEKDNSNSLILGKEGRLTLVDADRDGVYETVFMTKKSYLPVFVVNTYDNLILSNAVKYGKIDLSGEDILCKITKNGNEAVINDITQGDLLCYTVSDDGLYYEITAVNEEMSAKLLSVDKDERVMTTSQGDFLYNSFFAEFYLNTLQNGKNYDFALDDEGKVACVTNSEDTYVYGWIVKKWNDEDEKIGLKIFSASGVMERLFLAETVTIDGQKMRDYNIKSTSFDGLTDASRFVRYLKNKDGDIQKVDFAEDASGKTPSDEKNNNSLKRYFADESVEYHTNGKIFVPKFMINDSTVMFMIPKSETKRSIDTQYEVISSASLRNNGAYTVTTYDIDKDGAAGAVIFFDDKNVLETEAVSAAVESVKSVLNDDDEVVYELTLIRDGNFVRFTANAALNDKVKDLNPGDIIKYNYSGDEIYALNREYDCENDSLLAPDIQQVKYNKGYVYTYKDGYIGVLGNIVSYSYKDINLYYVGNIKITHIYMKRDADGNIRKVSVRQQPDETVRSFLASGETCDRVVLRSRFNALNSVWIYHIDK